MRCVAVECCCREGLLRILLTFPYSYRLVVWEGTKQRREREEDKSCNLSKETSTGQNLVVVCSLETRNWIKD